MIETQSFDFASAVSFWLNADKENLSFVFSEDDDDNYCNNDCSAMAIICDADILGQQ